jgi:hypothetical protein
MAKIDLISQNQLKIVRKLFKLVKKCQRRQKIALRFMRFEPRTSSVVCLRFGDSAFSKFTCTAKAAPSDLNVYKNLKENSCSYPTRPNMSYLSRLVTSFSNSESVCLHFA